MDEKIEKTEKSEKDKLELRKIKALEKIANSLDSLTIWFEEINKKEWGDRIQYYWAEDHKFKLNADAKTLLND